MSERDETEGGSTVSSDSPPGRYVHPLADRYASGEMQAIFSPRRRFGTWRRLWIALAEAEAELGVPIADDALAAMRDARDEIDLDRAAELERELRHDVMAHVHLYGEAAPEARGIIHLGATSAFITDNTDLLLHREALELVRARLLRCIRALADFAREHRELPTLGWTHFQPAQPTTVGKRATLWIQDLLLDVEEVDFRLSRTLRFRGVRGTTGTQASFLELFDGDGGKVDRLDEGVRRRLGFDDDYGVSGQTYPRKVDAALTATLAGVAESASKFGHDLRLLQHLGEVQEPFGESQVGSSAMPYKRNPVRAERICALARHVVALSQGPAHTAATQWLERSLDDSALRRMALPDAYLAVDGILVLVESVAGGLDVHPEVIRRRLAGELPFMASEAILMRATSRGGDRQGLHERIRVHAREAAARRRDEPGVNDLLDRIADDDAFGLGREELESLVEAERFVGRAPEQVDRFLAERVEPVLDAHADDGDAGAPEVRV